MMSVLQSLLSDMTRVGALLFIPYFLYGIWVARFFYALEPKDYHRFYATDLLGAACGCMASVFVLDAVGFTAIVAVTLGSAMFAAAIFGASVSIRKAAATGLLGMLTVLLISLPPIAARLERVPSIDKAGRNFDLSHKVVENWHR